MAAAGAASEKEPLVDDSIIKGGRGETVTEDLAASHAHASKGKTGKGSSSTSNGSMASILEDTSAGDTDDP